MYLMQKKNVGYMTLVVLKRGTSHMVLDEGIIAHLDEGIIGHPDEGNYHCAP
jgi:hypothetical protein